MVKTTGFKAEAAGKMNSVREELLNKRRNELATLEEKITKAGEAVEEATGRAAAATAVSDLESFRKAMADKNEAELELTMYRNRRADLEKMKMVKPEDGAKLYEAVMAEQAEIQDKATKEIMSLLQQVVQIGETAENEILNGDQSILEWDQQVSPVGRVHVGWSDGAELFTNTPKLFEDNGFRTFIHKLSENYFFTQNGGQKLPDKNRRLW